MAEKQFGPYRLVEQIAVGGMAEIHLAKTKGIAGFEKYVALKMIHPNFSQDQQFIEMLIDEAKLTVQLQHVNIAQTFDLGRVDETYYITMEFVDGADLYKLLRKGSEIEIDAPFEVAAFIAKEVANGLDYAHRKRDHMGKSLGIVHRDISPQNVLISFSGEVKLVDFGIAKATMRARQTAVGVIKGKYYYMSPEQAWGEPLDARSDIFSTGILLYEMLTGQMLYLEEDLHRLLDMVRRAEIDPPSTLRDRVPPQLEKIVMRALQRDPADRYQSAADLASDLERFLHAYSPVFTATKVTSWMDSILGERQPRAPAPEPKIDERRQTKRISRDQLFLDGSELTDENSVIFDVSELERVREMRKRKAAAAEAAPPAAADDPDEKPTVEGAKAVRKRHEETKQIEPGDLVGFDEDDVQERTVISGPPEMEGGARPTPGRRGPTAQIPAASPGSRNHPPMALESEYTDVDDSSFEEVRGDPTVPSEDDRTIPEPDRPEPSLGGIEVEATAIDDQPPTRPGRSAGPASSWQAAPALDAANPKPALSAIRKPRQSRRTPPGGHPAPRGSVLSDLLTGDGRGPRVAISSPSGPGQDRDRAAAAGSAGRELAPDPVASARPRQTRPIDGSIQVEPRRLDAPGGGAVPGPPPPLVGLPSPDPALMNTSARFAAMEVDDIPDRYKLRRGRGNKAMWIWIGVLAVALAAATVVAAMLGGEEEADPAATARIDIISQPPGGAVSVDGVALEGETPVVFRKARPGKTYVIAVERPGYERYETEATIPEGQDRTKVTATLKRLKVSLKIESDPSDAEVFLNGKVQGRTPLSLPALDPEAATEVVLRKRGFQPVRRRLDWSNRTELMLQLELKK